MIRKAGPRILGFVVFLAISTSDPTSVSAGESNSGGGRIAGTSQSASETGTQADPSGRYVINLKSSLTLVDQSELPRLEVFRRYRLYTTRFTKEGKVWHRLRLGFFPTKKAAVKMLESLRNAFPDAWIAYASLEERELARPLLLAAGSEPPPPAPMKHKRGERAAPAQDSVRNSAAAPAPAKEAAPGKDANMNASAPAISEERLVGLMEEAKAAMTAGDHARAVQLLTKILGYSDSRFRQEAQELLGLARERKGQLAHAKAEYEEYLRQYPEGEGAERVRQRLAGLLTARAQPKEKLRETGKTADGGWLSDVYGSFSQYYTRDDTVSEEGAARTNQSFLTTDLDVSTRMRSDRYEVRTQLNASHKSDFLNSEDSKTRIDRLYVDALDRDLRMSARIGRQSQTVGGVLGRFDGGLFGLRLSPKAQLNLVGGFPVDWYKSLRIDTERRFYGVNVDLGTFAEYLDFNAFFINQAVGNMTDRQAVGVEARYFHPNRSLLALADYDVSYNEANLLLFVGNWIFADKTTLNITLDYRKTPILTTSNALQGQSAGTIAGLMETRTEDEIRALARDRTATSRSMRLGLSRPLNDKLQIGGDITVSDMTGTVASGGVDATPETGTEVQYSAEVVGSGLVKEGDVTILGLRYFDSRASDRISAYVNTRYPVTREWRVNPRFRYDYRMIHSNNGTQSLFRPSLKVDYYYSKLARFELEAAGEWLFAKDAGEKKDTVSYLFLFGYRVDFW